MGVRQYIGARYVPLFFDNNGSTEWVANHAYEPLTIVTYLGNSYTSKKNVPSNVGNPASNPTYWASTGIYNSQIEQYREEVAEYKEQVDDVVEDITDINSELTVLANRDRNKSNYTYGRKFVFVGDSYALQTSNWMDYIITMLGINTDQYVKVRSGGRGFSIVAAGGTFTDLLTASFSAIDQNVTDVVVCGGINDYNATADQISAGIESFKTSCLYFFPNCQIHVGFISWENGTTYVNQLAKVCSTYKIASMDKSRMDFLDGAQMAMHRYDLFADDIHPNANGGLYIARCIKQCLTNGSCPSPFNVSKWTANDLSSSSDFTLALTGTVDTWIDSETIFLRLPRFNLSVKGTSSYTPTTWYKLFDFPNNGFLKGGVTYQNFWGVPIFINGSLLRIAELSAYNGSLWMRWYNISGDDAFSTALIDGGMYTFPLMYIQD